MVTGRAVAEAAPKYLGTPYSVLDCQAFVERCLRDAGWAKNLDGSNTWYRYCMSHGWVGTPSECIRKYGSIPVGAFLFILEQNGKEPEKYRKDGIGNASHIGLYTGMTGKEMVQMALEAGDTHNPKSCDFGDGAIHSSSTREKVATSKFAGKAISGGWNRIGLSDNINYGTSGGDKMEPYYAKVTGGGLNLRDQPNKNASRLCQIPDGTKLYITDEANGWAKTNYNGMDGWVMKDFLQPATDEDTVEVSRTALRSIYDQIGDWLGLRG